MKRKVVSMVLAGVMATSMLVGCGAKKEETSTPEETVAQEQTAEEKTEEKTETTDGAAETTAGDDSHEVNFPVDFRRRKQTDCSVCSRRSIRCYGSYPSANRKRHV